MNDYNNEIKILLDSLDKSANANTAWLHFDIDASTTFNIKQFLLKQLETGHFHFALVKSDIMRGREYYVHVIYPEHPKQNIIRLLRPGTTWNGKTELEIQSISIDRAKELIIDLLTGAGKHFSGNPSGTQLNVIEAERIVQGFIKYVAANNKALTFFQISPDFLWTIDESFNPENDETRLGYFENYDRDLALGILMHGKETGTLELNILLTNGY